MVTKVPLIIGGKPGSGKSISVYLIYKSMRGKYYKKNFLNLILLLFKAISKVQNHPHLMMFQIFSKFQKENLKNFYRKKLNAGYLLFYLMNWDYQKEQNIIH
jgi:hypothetical protein